MGLCICYAYIAIAVGAVIYLFNRWYRRGYISDFNGKYVFITGTDSGFGHKLAVDLDRLGLFVYAGCYTKEGEKNLKNKTSAHLKTISLDVTDQTSVDKAKSFIENDLPNGKSLWGVVNNAGICGNINFNLATLYGVATESVRILSRRLWRTIIDKIVQKSSCQTFWSAIRSRDLVNYGPLWLTIRSSNALSGNSILDDYRQVMEVNYFGSLRVTEAFEPLIKESKGRFVQISSMAGRGSVGFAPYTCSKFAIGPYIDELRRYMKPFGVKVSVIEPGCVLATGILDCEDCLGVLRSKFELIPGWKQAELGKNYLDKLIENYYEWLSKPLLNYNSVNMVTDSMIHALGAKRPKSRYLVGYEARFFVLLTGLAPDWFLDGFIQLTLWLLRQKQVKTKF